MIFFILTFTIPIIALIALVAWGIYTMDFDLEGY